MAKLKAFGSEFLLKTVAQAITSSPKVTVGVSEINTDEEFPIEGEFECQKILLYKREGHYVILFGKDEVLKSISNGQQQVSGVLITKHALKKAKIESLTQAGIDAITKHASSRSWQNPNAHQRRINKEY